MKIPTLPIGINTVPFSLKLRAIAKHSTALADDLDKIDNATCNDCGGLMDVATLKANDEVFDTAFNCSHCNEEEN